MPEPAENLERMLNGLDVQIQSLHMKIAKLELMLEIREQELRHARA